MLSLTMIIAPFMAYAQTESSPVIPAIVREQVRERAQNIRNNEDYRNNVLETQRATSTLRPMAQPAIRPLMARPTTTPLGINERREDRKEVAQERREDRKDAIQERKEERRENRIEMRTDIFFKHQANLVRQLERSIENLQQIRTRINERIAKTEQSGRNMTDAKVALSVADQKISSAVSAITDLKNYKPATSTLMVATTTDVNILKARQVGDVAIKAVKDAKESLNLVVRAIAKSMGLKLGDDKNATTTP